MNRSNVLEVVAMLRTLINSIEITHCGVNAKCHSTLLRDVNPFLTRFVLTQSAELIELLDGVIDEITEEHDRFIEGIKKLLYRQQKELKNSVYGKCANDASNFCGNCRYFVTITTSTGETAGRCNRDFLHDTDLDPDDASCEKFKPPYDTRTDQEVCEECAKKDSDDCNYKCPLYPF